MARSTQTVGTLSPPVLWRFAGTALLWLVPALLLLPVVLLLMVVSALASDGALLELGSGLRGKVLTALGPLLIGCGVAAPLLVPMLGRELDAEEWVSVIVFVVVALGCGVIATRYALRRIARELSA
ncbi:hypothetical protein [Haliangium ochraceum]|uniref:Uncharacterized protein n=1 Tax=Haliangium ochraceum (strain DSM 14365 / JCM 11303 / SMP-2) TaxID=502025 RepID=D0LZ18_HALO1|nr:hypothetical protein [Haliangium ochraceum]ACY14488.1 hypothetical protein Hoch_1942 [Haliangium ochraceum DSM 14365]